MSIENLTMSFSGQNRKSIDVHLSLELKNLTFKVFDDMGTEIVTRTVSNSLLPEPSPLDFTILCGGPRPEVDDGTDDTTPFGKIKALLEAESYYSDGSLTDEEVLWHYEALNLFDYNKNYTLVVFVDGLEVDRKAFVIEVHEAMLAPTVEGIGTRLIKVTFPYPVKNLEVHKDYKTYNDGSENHHLYALNNFYLELFNKDTNTSLNSDPSWEGHLVVHAIGDNPDVATDNKLSLPYMPTVSDDFRTLLIQANAKSLPLGEHTLKVAFAKSDNLLGLDILRDFHSVKGREIPVSAQKFISQGGNGYAAIASDQLRITGPNSVVVTFDKGVCVPLVNKFSVENLETWSLYSPSALGPFDDHPESARRVPYTLNEVEFIFGEHDFFKEGDLNFHLDYIKDIYGLDTDPKDFTVSIEKIPPELVSVTQDKTENATTAIIAEFSAPMVANPALEFSAADITNYTLTKENDTVPIPLQATITVLDNQTKFKILTVEELPTGMYTLIVKMVNDVYNSTLVEGSKTLLIEDSIVPAIDEILATSNDSTEGARNTSLLVKFSEEMAVDSLHGFNIASNYKFTANTSTDILTDIAPKTFMDNHWVKFDLDKNLTLTPKSDSFILSVGYPRKTDILYVTDKSGNIYPLCNKPQVDALVEPINIADCLLTYVDSNTIKLTLPSSEGNQYFNDVVNKEDFGLKIDGGAPITPQSATVLDTLRTIEFTFEDAFLSDQVIKMSILADATSTDIFGRPLAAGETTASITIKFPTKLLGASIIDRATTGIQDEFEIALIFSSDIDHLNEGDFLVKLPSGKPLVVNSAHLAAVPAFNLPTPIPASTHDHIVVLNATLTNLDNDLFHGDLVISTKEIEHIGTISNGLLIEPFENKQTVDLMPESLSIKLQDGADSLNYKLDEAVIRLTCSSSLDMDVLENVAFLVDANKSLVFNDLLKITLTTSDALVTQNAGLTYTTRIENGNVLVITLTDTNTIELAKDTLILATATANGYLIKSVNNSILSMEESVTYNFIN